MIEVTGIDLTRWNIAVTRYVQELGYSMQDAIKYRAGKLKERLVQQSPPLDRGKSAKRIESRIRTKFVKLGTKGDIDTDEGSHISSWRTSAWNQQGHGRWAGVEWLTATPRNLYGVAKALDKRNASVKDLQSLLPRITKSGNLRYNFLSPKRHQKIIISQKILTKPSTVAKVIAYNKAQQGKLKAAWAIEWDTMGIKKSLPQWIARHVPEMKARGSASFMTVSNKNELYFTIINTAAGVSKTIGIIRRSLAIEAKTIPGDIKQKLKNLKL